MVSRLPLLALHLYQRATGRHILESWRELRRTQWLSREELLKLQRDKLQRLLQYAYAYVPYYRQLFDNVGFRPDELSVRPASFRRIPLLSKAIIRRNFGSLLTTEIRRRRELSRVTTSGSTGEPLVFMQDNGYRDCVTAGVLRSLEWAGWRWGECHAYLWGASSEAKTAESLRARLMDLIFNRFVANAFVLSDESMGEFVAQVRKRRPGLLYGYASSLYRFAEFVRENRFNDVGFEAIISSAEVLYPSQRQFIEETLGGKVFDRYGTREVGDLGCECEFHTGFHVSVENCYIEIEREGEPVGPGEAGDIIVTNLNNYGMPFIRYALADVGAWCEEDRCPCGREMPLLGKIEGRQVDMFRGQDGRMVWGGFWHSMYEMEGVKQFQFIQKSVNHVVARIVKEGHLEQASRDRIERAVQRALGGNVTVEFEFPCHIPPAQSGKFRYQISELGELQSQNAIAE